MSGKGKTMVYYWDACVFLRWIADDHIDNGHKEVIRQILEDNKKDKNKIITSTITHIEVLSSQIEYDAERDYLNFFKRSTTDEIGVDGPIAREARRFRDFFTAQHHETGKTLSVPDSIHLATAIIWGADELHTFDAEDRRINYTKTIGLLPLDTELPRKTKLKICKPRGSLGPLFNDAKDKAYQRAR